MRHKKSCIIVGGGCAGLSLALSLAKKNLTDKILILESQPTLQGKQTWCYWNVRSHPFESCVTHRWSQWMIRQGRRAFLTHSPKYTYHHLPASTFFPWAQEELNRYPQVSIQLNTQVTQFKDESQQVSVKTSQGHYSADYVFDSRIPSTQEIQPTLLQHFHGWTVRAEQPIFNPHCVTLMDFFPCKEGVHFFYVLPFSAHEALVESTYFSPLPFPLTRYQNDIQHYLDQRYGSIKMEILRTETGTLPMQVNYGLTSHHPRILPIGTRAGWLKPSTGYGFLSIQRAVHQLTEAMQETSFPQSPASQSIYFRWLDQIFLSFIQSNFEKAPQIFHQLFTKAPTDSLIRFLGECATVKEVIQVMNCLPRKALLTHLLKKMVI